MSDFFAFLSFIISISIVTVQQTSWKGFRFLFYSLSLNKVVWNIMSHDGLQPTTSTGLWVVFNILAIIWIVINFQSRANRKNICFTVDVKWATQCFSLMVSDVLNFLSQTFKSRQFKSCASWACCRIPLLNYRRYIFSLQLSVELYVGAALMSKCFQHYVEIVGIVLNN